jgi:hypothetical protein
VDADFEDLGGTTRSPDPHGPAEWLAPTRAGHFAV